MYLKIQGVGASKIYEAGTKREDMMDSDWWLFECESLRWFHSRDLVKNIQKSSYQHDTAIMLNHWCGDVGKNHCSECVKDPDMVIEYIRVDIKYGEGKERYIIFDTQAFVLNEDGRTIERIVP